MNVPLSIVFLAEIYSLITLTEALPRWRWGAKSKHKHNYWRRRHSKTENNCSMGQCVQAWKCPKYATSNHSSDYCAYWNYGPMVCCVLNSAIETDLNSSDSFHSNEHSKDIRTTTQNYKFVSKNNSSTLNVEEPWNRKSWVRPTPLSSLGDVFKNSGEKFATHRPYNEVTNTHSNVWRTPGTTYSTTVSRNKTPSSESRIRFPTESAFIPKVSRHPAFTTELFKSTPYKKSTISWGSQSTSTTVPWGYTTAHTKKSSSNVAHSTKALKRTSDFKSTNSWAARSTTTMAPWGYTKRTVSKPTRFPSNEKSTQFPRVTMPHGFTPSKSDEKGWGKSTPVLPTKRQTSRTKPSSKPVFTRSTIITTRRYRATTPLPNVNTRLCGIRDERTVINRERRNYENERSLSINATYSDISIRGKRPFQRIVGGEEAEPFSWPWVAALYKVTSSGGNRFLSAGALINENFVLTAAHVFTPDDLRTSSYVVMLGTHNAQDAVAQYLVSTVLRHPRYQNRYYYHDIALLKLEKPVVFSSYIMPICLPSHNAPLLRDIDLEGKDVTVMGWGDDSFGGKSSRVLKEATFPVVSRISCNASYVRVASNRFPKGITNDMLCAGDPNGGKDACQGDSGGPLTSIENGRYTQVGIVSFGYQCGDKEFPGVYTKVAPYLSWIAENTLRDTDYGNDYY